MNLRKPDTPARAAARARYHRRKAADPEKVRAEQAASSQAYRERNRAADLAATRARVSRWRREFPERKGAHGKVAWAVQSGKLQRQSCEVCADPQTHAHHDDYSKPLDVRWLCKAHHAEAHREEVPHDQRKES